MSQQQPPTWPFRTEQELAEHEALRRQGFALLARAHELFMAAVKERGK